MKQLNLITIGYGKQSLQNGSREQKRMQSYDDVVTTAHFVVFTQKSDNLPDRYVYNNVHIYGTNSNTKIGMVWDAFWLVRGIVKNTPTTKWIVSSQDPFETSIVGYVNAWAKNAVHHIQLHGDFYSNNKWKQENPLNRIRARFGLFVLRRASSLRVVSLRIKRSIVGLGVQSQKIHVLPVDVPLDAFLKVGTKKTYADTTITFLYAGRFAREKNLTLLLRAFAHTCVRHNNIRLRMIGDGPELVALQNLAKKLQISPLVEWISWTNDIASEYSKADVFVLPSNHEGYALVLIEAMASGLPVITTDVGCVGEQVLHGRHGLVFDKGDTAALAAHMETYSTDVELRRNHAREAYTQAQHIAAASTTYTNCWKESFFTP